MIKQSCRRKTQCPVTINWLNSGTKFLECLVHLRYFSLVRNCENIVWENIVFVNEKSFSFFCENQSNTDVLKLVRELWLTIFKVLYFFQTFLWMYFLIIFSKKHFKYIVSSLKLKHFISFSKYVRCRFMISVDFELECLLFLNYCAE